jgi:thiol:disulfide interchange protein DsbA
VKKSIMMLLSFVMLIPSVAMAEYEAGKHYAVIEQPVRTQNSSKIEVAEVFWYGCIHCFKFEPAIKKWKANLAEDVVFVPTPAQWNKRMSIHAQAYYTAEALGVLEKVHEPLFKALNVERKKLASESELADFFEAYGVDKETFEKTFNSFGVNSAVARADARTRGYKITGTPELVVQGKYRISASMAGGQEEMLKVADYLIAKERGQ